MELVVIFLVIFIIYGAGWIWQTVNDVLRDINRNGWDHRASGPVGGGRGPRRKLGGHDLAELRRVYSQFADSVDGQPQDRSPAEAPKVAFVHKTSRALLSICESNDDPPECYTQLTYSIGPGWSYRVEIFPERAAGGGARHLNIEDIRIGDAEFDPRFVIKANDPEFVRELLDPATRGAIEDLRRLLRNERILVSINSSRLLVRKPGIVASAEDLARFVERSHAVHERVQAFWQRSTGIEILEEPAPSREAALPVCRVCGTQIPEENRVDCRRCKTPHHGDCWSFNDGCSTYACGEKRFVKR